MQAMALFVIGLLICLISVFMVLLILVQRGRGGGIAGALGGAGGQSAFGSKAGDVFTRITVVTAMIWGFLILVLITVYNHAPARILAGTDDAVLTGLEENGGSGAGGDAGAIPLPGESGVAAPGSDPLMLDENADPAPSTGSGSPAGGNPPGSEPVTETPAGTPAGTASGGTEPGSAGSETPPVAPPSTPPETPPAAGDPGKPPVTDPPVVPPTDPPATGGGGGILP